VEEIDSKLPFGYSIYGYAENGDSDYLINVGDPENTGIVKPRQNPSLLVKNKRGYVLVANKIWADSETVAEHGPVYMAVYKKEKDGENETYNYVEGTLKQLCHPDTSLKWYLPNVSGDFKDYVVREVKGVTDTSADGNDNSVLEYTETMEPVQDGGKVSVDVKQVGSESFSNENYCVSYTQDDISSYIRKYTVTNTPEVSLTLTKTVTGNFGNKKKDFSFTLTVEGAAEGAVYEWTKNGVNQPSLSSGGTFTMRHGDEVIIYLPPGAKVTVTESNENYTTTFKLNSGQPESGNSKTFTMGDDSTLAVTNTLNVNVATGIMSRLGGKLILTLLPVIFVAAAWFVKKKYYDRPV
jgi:hypothetical protein